MRNSAMAALTILAAETLICVLAYVFGADMYEAVAIGLLGIIAFNQMKGEQ